MDDKRPTKADATTTTAAATDSGCGDPRARGNREAGASRSDEEIRQRGSVVVHVTFEPGEPIAGSATTDVESPGLAFSGWLGFVEVLDVLRRGTHRVAP